MGPQHVVSNENVQIALPKAWFFSPESLCCLEYDFKNNTKNGCDRTFRNWEKWDLNEQMEK